jgi:hypothetical protein
MGEQDAEWSDLAERTEALAMQRMMARFASAETWLETEENRNPSQHNMRRAGLTEVHVRPNWVWQAS